MFNLRCTSLSPVSAAPSCLQVSPMIPQVRPDAENLIILPQTGA